MVSVAWPTNDFAKPRSGVKLKRIGRAAGHGFTGIAADERPFFHLPLHLNHVEDVILLRRAWWLVKYPASPFTVSQGNGIAASAPYMRMLG